METAETADKAVKEPAVKASADGEASFEELLNESFKENENSKVVTGTVENLKELIREGASHLQRYMLMFRAESKPAL